MKPWLTRVISVVLVALFIVATMPVSILAETAESTQSTNVEYVSTFKSVESTLAPGITQTVNSGYGADGKLINYYVAIADINRSDVGIQATYKDAQSTVAGMAKMTEQVVSMTELHSDSNDTANYIPYYAVAAGINGDGYDTGSGRPSGVHIMNGVPAFGIAKTANSSWFAVFEDGTALCGANDTDWDEAIATHGPAKEAIGGFQLVRKNGVDCSYSSGSYLNDGRYPRSFVGVTADNKVVFMVADGNGAGGSAGTNWKESVEIMTDAGCTYILCLDGGGSATYIARPEGSNDVQVSNVPSDGSERAVSNGLIMYTTTPPSNTFDHANVTAKDSYIVPGADTEITAIGVSPAGTSADIPDNAVWNVTGGTLNDGVFTAGNTTGDATLSLMIDGKSVGTTTIHIVIPDKIEFTRSIVTIPYGKTVELAITAKKGINTVKTCSETFDLTMEDATAGSLSGMSFTAAESGVGTKVTATLKDDPSVSASVEIKLGKGSEVVMNFEAGTAAADLTNWGLADQADGSHIHSSISIVTPETGMVHGGDRALAFNYKMDEGIHGTEFWAGNGLRWLGDSIELKNATGVGFWLYVPEDAVQLGMFVNLFTHGEDGQMNGRVLDESSEYHDADLGYSGWRYIYMPLSGGTYYIEDNADKVGQSFDSSEFKYKANKFICFYAVNIDAWKNNLTNFAGDFTFYIDDVTVDYSDAVSDRELPIFSDMTYAVPGMSDAATLAGQTVNSNIVSFAGKVADDMTKDNATGLNVATAVVYIDGEAVDCTFDNGVISVDDYYLADGTHTIRMGICDNQGNYAEIRKQITVNSGNDQNSVYVVPQDPSLEYMLNDSVYWIDIKADAVETVSKITVKLDLDSMNNWELDHMTVLSGFACDWKFATANDKAENIVTLVFTRNGYVSATGNATIASLPIRVWEYVSSDDHKHANAVEAWKCNYVCAPALSVDVETEYGVVEYIDGASHTFSSPDIKTYCVSYTYGVHLKDHSREFYESHCFHVHSADAIADRSATCTEDGYTGRTWCATCNSPVVWGTTIPATGHSFSVIDGVLKCSCGEKYNGIYDGALYVGGVIANGWINDSYYANGVKLTGIQVIDGYYYDLGDDGVCKSQTKYTGKFYNEDLNGYCYSIIGELQTGWYLVDNIWHYFRWAEKTAITGSYTFANGKCAGITYVFDDEGKLTDGVWHTRKDGNIQYFYGPDCYKWANNMLQKINGKIYCFDKDGYLYRGWQIVKIGAFAPYYLYHFDDVTGELYHAYENDTGIVLTDESGYYLVNGEIQRGLGMIIVDGAQYYVRGNGLIAVGKYYIGAGYTGCEHLKPGYYNFGEDGKFVGEWSE